MTIDTHEGLLVAARAIIEAREDQMLTVEEWEGLQRALLAAEDATAPEQPQSVFRDGRLVRTVHVRPGEARLHACSVDDLEAVAAAITEVDGWFVVEEIATATERGWITALIGVEFLMQHGLVHEEGTRHRLRAAEGFGIDAALAEFAVGQMGHGVPDR